MPTEPLTLSRERKKFLISVFITALEGGIGYWSLASEYHWRKADAPKDAWMDEAEDLDGFYAIVHEITDDEDEPEAIHQPDRLGILPGTYYSGQGHRIDAEVIEKGIRLFTLYCMGVIDGEGNQVPLDDITPIRPGHYWNQFLVANATNGDDGDYDSDVADVIVQLALFGEVKYG